MSGRVQRASQCAASLLTIGLAAALLSACGENLAAVPREVQVDGLGRPVAVVHDAEADVYLVACQPESGAAYVVAVSPSGEVGPKLLEDGVRGVSLQQPVALAIAGANLLVADGKTLAVFDRQSGAVGQSIAASLGLIQGVSVAPNEAIWLFESDGQGKQLVRRIRADHDEVRAEIAAPVVDETVAAGQIVAIQSGAYVLDGSSRFVQVDNEGRVTELLRLDQEVRGLVRPGPGQWWTTGVRESCLLVLDTKGGIRQHPDLKLDDPGLFDLDRKRQRLVMPLRSAGRLLLRKL